MNIEDDHQAFFLPAPLFLLCRISLKLGLKLGHLLMMPGYHPLLGLNGIEQMKCPSQRMSPSSNVGSRIKWTEWYSPRGCRNSSWRVWQIYAASLFHLPEEDGHENNKRKRFPPRSTLRQSFCKSSIGMESPYLKNLYIPWYLSLEQPYSHH